MLTSETFQLNNVSEITIAKEYIEADMTWRKALIADEVFALFSTTVEIIVELFF